MLSNPGRRCARLIFLCLGGWFLCAFPVSAHVPHDVISEVELSANFEADKTLYIIAGNNLYKSADAGENWRHLVNGLDFRGRPVSLSIPAADSRVVYLACRGGGMYISEDSGRSWRRSNDGFGTEDLRIALASPASSSVALAAGQNALYKTSDRGNRWEEVYRTGRKITAVGFFGRSGSKVLLGERKGDLLYTDDGCRTWQKVHTFKKSGAVTALASARDASGGLVTFVGTRNAGVFKSSAGRFDFSDITGNLKDKRVQDLKVLQRKDGGYELYASTYAEGVFVSENGGAHWEKRGRGLTKHRQAVYLQSAYFFDLELPNAGGEDKTVFLGGFDGLFVSRDSGVRWRELETISPGVVLNLEIAPGPPKNHTIAVSCYAGGEAYLSTDGADTWKLIGIWPGENSRYPGYVKTDHFRKRLVRVFDFEFSPAFETDQTMFATTKMSCFLKSEDGGAHWKDLRPGPGLDEPIIAVSPAYATDRRIYLGCVNGDIYRSVDAGEHFERIGNIGDRRKQDMTAMVISPGFSRDETLFAAGYQGVYASRDGGRTWRLTTEGLPFADQPNVRLAISPGFSEDGTLLAGGEGGLFMTADGAASWTVVESEVFKARACIEGIAISPDYGHDRTFIISVRGRGLFKTEDAGISFKRIGEDLIADNYELSHYRGTHSAGMPVRFSPSYARDRTLYGFGSAKTELFRSADGGKTWQILKIPRRVGQRAG